MVDSDMFKLSGTCFSGFSMCECGVFLIQNICHSGYIPVIEHVNESYWKYNFVSFI